MIELPNPTHQAWLRSFWLIFSTFWGFLIGITLALMILPAWSGFGVLAAVLIFLPGMWRPHAVVDKPYRAWNKLAHSFAEASQVAITGVVFYIIFLITGPSRKSLRLDRPEAAESGWIPRETLSPDAYHAQYDAVTRSANERNWLHNYTLWTMHSGNLWALSLVPFLALLAALGTKKQENVPVDTYTLF